MSAPGEPTTIRALMERIRDRHLTHASVHFTPLRARCPVCQDCMDAHEALAILDNAVRDFIDGDGECVLVPDPEVTE